MLYGYSLCTLSPQANDVSFEICKLFNNFTKTNILGAYKQGTNKKVLIWYQTYLKNINLLLFDYGPLLWRLWKHYPPADHPTVIECVHNFPDAATCCPLRQELAHTHNFLVRPCS